MNEAGEQTGPERSAGGDEGRDRGGRGGPFRDASYKTALLKSTTSDMFSAFC